MQRMIYEWKYPQILHIYRKSKKRAGNDVHSSYESAVYLYLVVFLLVDIK